MEKKTKNDKIILNGVLQKFSKYNNHSQRMYPNYLEVWEKIIYEEKIKRRKEKIKNIFDEYEKEGN